MKRIFTSTLLFMAAVGVFAQQGEPIKNDTIEKVVVKTYRIDILLKNLPTSTEVISAKDIKRSTATSLSEAIKLNSASESADMQGLTGGVEFRGYAPSSTGTNMYTLMLSDGMPMGTKNAAASFLSNISSIELSKGPFSSIYGSGAMGGVINVISMQSRGKVKGNATLGGGSVKTMFASLSAGGSITKRLDFDAGLDYFKRGADYRTGSNNLLKTTGYEKRVFDTNAYDTVYNNSGYDKRRAALRLGYDISKTWRIDLYNDLYYTGDAGANGMLWGMYEQTDKKVVRNYHRLEFNGAAKNHNLRIAPYFSNESSDYTNDYRTGYKNISKYDYKTFGFLAQDAIKLSFGSFVFGVDNYSQKYTSSQSEEDGTPTAPYQPDYMNTQTGLFAQLNVLACNDRFSLLAGLRYDNILFRTYKTSMLDTKESTDDYNTVNPNLSMQFRISKMLRLHAGLGTAFLAPDAFKMTGEYSTAWGKYKGNPDLKPETSFSYEAGIGFQTPDNALEADATLFSTKHKNMIIYDYSNQDYTTFANSNIARMSGIELLFSFDVGRMMKKNYSLRLFGNYTRIFHSEVETPYQTGERKYISRTKAALGIDYHKNRLSMRFACRYVGSNLQDNWVYTTDWNTGNRSPFVTPSGTVVRPSLINENNIRVPDYMLMDVSASYRIVKHISVGVKVANLTDELYMERDGYYLPGRNFSFSLSVNF